MQDRCQKCKQLESLARRLSAGLLLVSSDVWDNGMLRNDEAMRREIPIMLDDADKVLDISDLRANLEILKAQGANPMTDLCPGAELGLDK